MAKRKAARRASERPERQQDPRLVAVRVERWGDEIQPPGTWALLVSPVAMPDGRMLNWHPPQPVAFSLVEARRLCDRVVAKRLNIIGNAPPRPNGSVGPDNPRAVADVIAALWSAVLHSFAAIEAMVNIMVDRLPPETTITVGSGSRKREVAQPDMALVLSTEDKLKHVAPLLDDCVNVAGDARVWRQFRELKKLRDDLVHTKEGGYDPDPQVQTAYDRLILGEGDDCWRKALNVVQAAWPGFLGELALSHLTAND